MSARSGGQVQQADHGVVEPLGPHVRRVDDVGHPSLRPGGERTHEPGAHGTVLAANGIFRAFALAGGRAVATWSYGRGEVTLAPFSELDGATAAALERDAADVVRFLGAATQPG